MDGRSWRKKQLQNDIQREMSGLGRNRWGLFNGGTRYANFTSGEVAAGIWDAGQSIPGVQQGLQTAGKTD